LSLAQEQLWHLRGALGFYTSPIQGAYRFQGELQTAALNGALAAVIRRHDILRTLMTLSDGHPRQVPGAAEWSSSPLMDLSDISMPERLTHVRHHIAQDARDPFDLTNGPVIRATLFRLAPRDHILLISMPRLISDDCSVSLLVHELVKLYTGYVTNTVARVPDLPIQYADYAAWQRATTMRPNIEQGVEYWRRQFTGEWSILKLPTDYTRSSSRMDHWASLAFVLDKKVTTCLAALCRQEDTTLFTSLLAAFQVLLCRHTGENRFFLGTHLDTRNRSELRNLIGPFSNIAILKAELSRNLTFRKLIRKVRQTTSSVSNHQHALGKFLELLKSGRELNQNAPFQVMFTVSKASPVLTAPPALVVNRWPIEPMMGAVDLSVIMQVTDDDSLNGRFEYSGDVFHESTIKRLLERWKTLLEDIVAHPGHKVSTFEIVPTAEKALLAAWSNGTRSEQRLTVCAHHLFELRAIETPAAIAVRSVDGELTYRHLNEQANRLANYLRRHGVRPELPVAICLESSLEAVVAILAILKAGGVYVPIDPAYPTARMEFILADVGAAVVVTRKSLLNILPQLNVPIVCVDVEWPSIRAESAELTFAGATASNLCYIIYTSGSTGKPKGVTVEHRSLVNYIHAVISDYCLGPGDCILQFASLSFDTSIEEIFPCLSCGATLVVRDTGFVDVPSTFWSKCRDRNLTVLHLPTSYWHMLVTDVEFGASVLRSSLRLVIIGGERALTPQVACWQREVGDRAKLVNTYGVTEATAHVTACWQLHEQIESETIVPIGRPICNVQTHVLDSELQAVPVGIDGELYIGGAGLARGYQGRPELTARRFVPDPFATSPGARLYRTGDRVRWRWDGQLEYLGRLDHQVKISGRRIELGEIETVLVEHPDVAQAAVIVDSAPLRMIAYVVLARPDNEPNAEQLRAYLKKKLPSYMVPASFIVVEGLPLTERGKIDRQALLKLDGGVEDQGESIQGSIEAILARIWRQVLGIKTVGRHENFGELGGDSIQALSVISSAELHGLRITIQQVFKYPTIAGLAAVAVPISDHAEIKAGFGGRVEPLKRMNRDQIVPLSLGQQHLWSLNQAVPGNDFFNIPTSVRISGALDVVALERSFGELIHRHEILRTTYVVRDGRPFQLISPRGQSTMRILDLADLPAEARETKMQEIIANVSRRSFDLSCEAPLRLLLLRLGAEEYVLILTLHHVAFDDWSYAILIKEVMCLYQTFADKRRPPAATSGIQYADYAVWQNDWLQSPAADREVSYWLLRLGGGPPLRNLPTDNSRSVPRTFRYGVKTQRLEHPLWTRLQQFAREGGTTPFMGVLGALNLLLAQLLGTDEIWIGTLCANRNPKTEDVIGLFVNTVIVRTDISGDPTFNQLLSRVRSVMLEALEHQALPFERLLDEINKRLDLAGTPLFQVLFIAQNVPTPAMRLQGLIVEPLVNPKKTVEISVRPSTFDLIVEVAPIKKELNLIWRYNADLFEPHTIETILTHFDTLLASVLKHPERRLSSWPRIARN
jgi:amino acid adenylation domain-containing protein